METSSSDLDFRAVAGGMLVGFFVLPLVPGENGVPKREPPAYSPDKYRIDFATGRVKKATESEWNAAKSYVVFRDSAWRKYDTTPEGRLRYEGKLFSRNGTQWPRWAAPGRVSVNGGSLAVYGWDGEIRIASEYDLLFKQNRIKGTYYVDIYDGNSGARALYLSGSFDGVPPDDLFGRSAWISTHYYFLPLDTQNMNRFVLCDAKPSGAPFALTAEAPIEPGGSQLARIAELSDAQIGSLVVITVPVAVQMEGGFHLSMDLVGRNGKVAKSLTAGHLKTGNQKLVLYFNAADLIALGVGGPYTEANARLLYDSLPGSTLVAQIDRAGVTRAYTLDSFTRSLDLK
jgi:hypothetical protein